MLKWQSKVSDVVLWVCECKTCNLKTAFLHFGCWKQLGCLGCYVLRIRDRDLFFHHKTTQRVCTHWLVTGFHPDKPSLHFPALNPPAKVSLMRLTRCTGLVQWCPMTFSQCGSRFPMFTTSNICETMVALANWRNQHSSAIGSNNNNAGPDKFESIQRRFYD